MGAPGRSAWRYAPLVRVVAAVALVTLGGAIAGWLTPRGPFSTAAGLLTIAGGLTLGFLGGRALGSRWAYLVAPVVFVVAFELVRRGQSGPTVDGIHLDSLYGMVAAVSGRGVHGLLVLVPMLAGVAWGVRGLGRWGSVVVGVGLVVLVAAVARPAGTEPIRDEDGAVVAGSVAELAEVRLSGSTQTVMLRGRSVDSPVLLFLPGGPGGSELGAMRLLGEELEDDFVVATWDVRGAGSSAGSYLPVEELTLDRAVEDVLDMAGYLQGRFGPEPVYVVGNSWGSLTGVLAVQRSPELFAAYVGTGQMVDPDETDVMFWEDTIAWAESRGDDGLVAKLRSAGPPPYEDVRHYEGTAAHEHDWNSYEMVPGYLERGEMPGNLFVAEYTLLEQLRTIGTTLDSFAALYPQASGLDLRAEAPRLEVPVHLVQGAHEARGRAVLAREWFDLLDAPVKEWIELENSGHKALFEEPGRFHEVMLDVVASVEADVVEEGGDG